MLAARLAALLADLLAALLAADVDDDDNRHRSSPTTCDAYVAVTILALIK